MEVLIFMSLICAVIGMIIDGGRGFVLGLCLGLIGLLISAVLAGQGSKS